VTEMGLRGCSGRWSDLYEGPPKAPGLRASLVSQARLEGTVVPVLPTDRNPQGSVSLSRSLRMVKINTKPELQNPPALPRGNRPQSGPGAGPPSLGSIGCSPRCDLISFIFWRYGDLNPGPGAC
jgi:hypothetical protein